MSPDTETPDRSAVQEWMLAAYVDGELDGAELRQVEAHLVRSEESRRRVLALREEARLLTDLFHERELPAEGGAVLKAPAQGLALGIPASLAAFGAALAVVGALLETRLPSGTSWLRPSRLFGVNEMLFDVVFLVRDRAPEWVEFAVAVAALASMAALFSFVAGAVLRRFPGTAAVALALLPLAASPAEARVELALNQGIEVPEGEVLEATVVASGDDVVVDGVIEGDLYAFAERLTIRGRVDGNVIGPVRELDISGEVTGMLLVFSENARVEGRVRSLVGGCDRLTVAPGGRVERDLAFGGERLFLEGEVGRDVTAWGDRLELSGPVGRNVEVWAERAVVRKGARIAGSVYLHAASEEALEVAPAATVVGGVEFLPMEMRLHDRWERYSDPHLYLWALWAVASALLVGLLAYLVAPGFFEGLAVSSQRDFLISVGIGFVALICAPLAIVLLALTVVGIPLALLALAVYVIAFYLAGILVATLIGVALLKPAKAGLREFGTALLLGLLLVTLGENLPFIGVPFAIVVALLGMGLLVERGRRAWETRPRAG